eukprot:c8939_g1_i4.p1 GENE.c8939_g1_i4~~c8939_g1_i4.p1  ORF type:complete len:150 (+),score=27.80 c8939_g1_i4:22-450(+)
MAMVEEPLRMISHSEGLKRVTCHNQYAEASHLADQHITRACFLEKTKRVLEASLSGILCGAVCFSAFREGKVIGIGQVEQRQTMLLLCSSTVSLVIGGLVYRFLKRRPVHQKLVEQSLSEFLLSPSRVQSFQVRRGVIGQVV